MIKSDVKFLDDTSRKKSNKVNNNDQIVYVKFPQLMTHQEKSNNQVNNNDHGYGNTVKQVADMHLES